MPRHLITGASGLLGRAVQSQFEVTDGWTGVGTALTRADPPRIVKCDFDSDFKGFEGLFHEHKPDVVIHCAANRSPDSCAKDLSAATRINASAVTKLAKLCAASSTLFIYISTDYVFPGIKGQAPYAETLDGRAPTNHYGVTKAAGEDGVLETNSTSKGWGIVLRVPVLYGHVSPEKGNAESAINILYDKTTEAIDGKAVKMDDWAIRSPTCTEDVARVVLDLARTYLDKGHDGFESMPKIVHFTSEDRVTKYRICEIFAEILGVELKGMERDVPSGENKGEVQRPYDTHLGMENLKSLGIPTRTVDFEVWWRLAVGAFRH